MAEPKRAKKKRTKRERKERRFSASDFQAHGIAVGAGFAGALALGAGVYAEWIRPVPTEYAPFLLAGGAFTLGGALIFGDVKVPSVRVGDSGLAVERGGELVRVAWCDIDRVYVEGSKLFVKSKEASFSIPIKAQKAAVAWILAEGTRRVSDIMDVKRDTLTGLPEPKETDGELVTVEDLQVAGRHCAKSGKAISFERDARLCPNCGQVYHHTSVPKRCVTCKTELGDKAVAV